MAKILGIDLGTTNSAMAIMEAGSPEIIENSEGNRTTPSWVAFTEDGERLVGDAAKNQAANNTSNTLFDVKRIIGRKFSDPGRSESLSPDRSNWRELAPRQTLPTRPACF